MVVDQAGENDPVRSAALGQAVTVQTVRAVEQALRARGYDVDLSARWDGIVGSDGSVLVNRDELGWLANGVLQFGNSRASGQIPVAAPGYVAPELAAKVGWATQSDALLYVNVKGVATTGGKRAESVLAGVFIVFIILAVVLVIAANSKGGGGGGSSNTPGMAVQWLPGASRCRARPRAGFTARRPPAPFAARRRSPVTRRACPPADSTARRPRAECGGRDAVGQRDGAPVGGAAAADIAVRGRGAPRPRRGAFGGPAAVAPTGGASRRGRRLALVADAPARPPGARCSPGRSGSADRRGHRRAARRTRVHARRHRRARGRNVRGRRALRFDDAGLELRRPRPVARAPAARSRRGRPAATSTAMVRVVPRCTLRCRGGGFPPPPAHK